MKATLCSPCGYHVDLCRCAGKAKALAVVEAFRRERVRDGYRLEGALLWNIKDRIERDLAKGARDAL